MTLKKVNIPAGAKLFQVHTYMYMTATATYQLEIQEFADGKCAGHGEHSTDKNQFLHSVSGSSVEDCLQKLIDKTK
jgi:hypothetical protein